MSAKRIKNVRQLAEEVGCYESGIAKAIFRGTECGVVCTCSDEGVHLSGYAEGADAECLERFLPWGFTAKAFWDTVEAADEDGCELFDEWNDDEGCWI